MANLNKVLLIGRLTRDPELRFTPSGTAVAEFGLAVNRQWTDPNGEKKESTCFVDVQAWGRQGEVINEYMKKGRQIFIEGRLDYSSWEGQDGKKQSRIRVVVDGFQFLDGGRRSEEPAEADSYSGAGGGGGARKYPSPRPAPSSPEASPGRSAPPPPEVEPPPAGEEYNLGDPPF